jgi:hypothetical protein
MKLTDKEVSKIMKLQDEIDREAGGRCRGVYIKNRTRQVRLIVRKAQRREAELETRIKKEGLQLSLF